MLFCFEKPTVVPIEYWTIRSIKWAAEHDFGGDYFSIVFARKLYEQIKGCKNNQAAITLEPEDIDPLIKEYHKHEEGSDGNMIKHVFDCLCKNTKIDLRKVTWEQIQALGTDPGYSWLDPKPGAKPWPAVKLLIRCTLIMWDGHEAKASWGDYIVKCSEDPPIFGRIGYMAHEIGYLKTVHNEVEQAA